MGLSATGRALEASGVSRAAIATTLETEGHHDLREFVVEELYFNEEEHRYVSMSIHGPKTTSPRKSRLVFNLLAKEILLSRCALRVFSLYEFADVVCGRDEKYTQDYIMDMDMVFVTDFYEDGAGFPLNDYDAMVVRSFVRRLMEEGLAFCTLTELPLLKCTKWWPQQFLSLISEYSNQITVK